MLLRPTTELAILTRSRTLGFRLGTSTEFTQCRRSVKQNVSIGPALRAGGLNNSVLAGFDDVRSHCDWHITHSISATNGERLGHPTQKPEAVIRWSMQQVPEWNDVIDPFIGSGTTLRAAKDLGRVGVGIEIEEKYCEIAAKRLAQKVLSFE